MSRVLQVLLVGLPTLGLALTADSCSPNATANDVAKDISLAGKVAVVTGGDSGLGFAAAESFARAGATVVIAGHNAVKTEAAARNLSGMVGAEVRGMPVDLSSLASVRALAANISLAFPGPLHILVNDAGITHATHGDSTADGFETVFETNFLGHFLLTELLLPALRRSGAARIVNVASTAAETACSSAGWPEDCLKDFTFLPPPAVDGQPFNGTTGKAGLYGLSKFAMIQHAAEISRREALDGSGVQAFSVGPGIVDTGITSPAKVQKLCDMVNDGSSNYTQHPCPYTAQQGAAVVAFSAIRGARPGGWFLRYTGCREDPPVNMQGFEPAMRIELYDRALQWVGLAAAPSRGGTSFVV